MTASLAQADRSPSDEGAASVLRTAAALGNLRVPPSR